MQILRFSQYDRLTGARETTKDLHFLDLTGCNKLQILRSAQDDMTGGFHTDYLGEGCLFRIDFPSSGEKGGGIDGVTDY